MKKLATTLLAASMTLAAGAQSLNVIDGNVTYSFNAEQTGLMEYSDGGKTLTIQGMSFDLSQVRLMKVVEDVLDDNTVTVVYDGNSAEVTIAGNVARYVSATVSDANVTLTQSEEVGSDTGEILYILSGESSNGSLVLNGKYKCGLELQGLTLTNPNGAAIDIENSKRVEFSSKNGFVNTLEDGAGGKQKAALYCTGHLEFKGKGTLNVTGNTGHAIAAKEYVEIKNCTINILKAPKDGINCTQYFLMESGTLNIDGVDGDGIQVDFKDAEGEREEGEDTGTITVQGGKITMNITGVAAKGFKSEADFVISGGEVTVTNSGAGEWDSSKLKTKAASCIGADGDVNVLGGTLNLTATGGGGKGISCDGTFTMEEGGNVNISTSGGVLAYVNNQLSQDYTGNTDRLNSDYKSSPKGIKADTEVTINGGTIYVKTIGNNGEGIESKGVLTINDGDITIRAKDDGINASNDLIVNGGQLNVIATNNDGLDANGNIYINGGVVRAFGGRSPECGIDANDEQGYTVYLTGGYLLAVGGSNSYPRNSGSTQPYVTTTGSITGGETISISGTDVDYSFTVPEDYTTPSGGNNGGWGPGWGPGGSGSGNMTIMISVPGMTNNTSYTVKNGSTTTTATSRLTGSSGGGGRW